MSSETSSRPLANSWKQSNLESLLTASIGGIWGEESGLSEVDVDVVRVTELKAHGFIEPSTAAKRSITKKQFQSRALEVGDLLLEKSGGGPNTPVGRVGYVMSIDKPMVCSNFMQLMRPDSKRVLSKYLHFFLTSLHSNGETIPMQTSTTNIRNIKTPEYMAVPVPVPSLPEQEKIVEILEEQLSRLDAALASVRTVREKSARFRRSLLHAAFTGVLTGHDTSDGTLPDGWVQKQLGEIADVGWGDLQVTKSSYVSNGYLAYSATGADGFLDYFDFDEDGIVLSAIGAGCGRTWYAKGRWSCIKNTMRILEKSKEVNLRFLFQHLSDPEAWPKRGSGQPFISQKDARELEVIIPPLAEQEKIVRILEEQLSRLDASLVVADLIDKKASALRRSLLHAAFTGNLTKEWREGAHV